VCPSAGLRVVGNRTPTHLAMYDAVNRSVVLFLLVSSLTDVSILKMESKICSESLPPNYTALQPRRASDPKILMLDFKFPQP
jgi:hypothetical protein